LLAGCLLTAPMVSNIRLFRGVGRRRVQDDLEAARGD
jgi:hypothetical protein